MYLENHFKEDNIAKLQQYIRDYSFGLLVIADDEGIDANHVPFYLNTEISDSLGYLQCHLARKNPIWQRLQGGAQVLAVFQGPDAYISPSWYETKKEHGRAVPTWNYMAIHAKGCAQVTHDPDWLKHHLRQLTDHHESQMSTPWSLDDAPGDYTERLVKAIVGIEIKVEALTGKLKASQNQPERNRVGIKAGLEQEEAKRKTNMSSFIN